MRQKNGAISDLSPAHDLIATTIELLIGASAANAALRERLVELGNELYLTAPENMGGRWYQVARILDELDPADPLRETLAAIFEEGALASGTTSKNRRDLGEVIRAVLHVIPRQTEQAMLRRRIETIGERVASTPRGIMVVRWHELTDDVARMLGPRRTEDWVVTLQRILKAEVDHCAYLPPHSA